MNVTSIPEKQMVPLFIQGKNTVDFVIPGLDPESSLTNNESHSNNELHSLWQLDASLNWYDVRIACVLNQ